MDSVLSQELESWIDSWALGTASPEIAQALTLLSEESAAIRERMRESSDAVTACAASHATTPPPALRQRLLDRIAAPSTAAYVTVDPDAKTWRATLFPGVWSKRLFTDRQLGLYSHLVRLDPGAQITPHRHDVAEQCFVLEGDVFWGEERVRPGQFVAGSAGAMLPAITAPKGALMLIVGPSHAHLA